VEDVARHLGWDTVKEIHVLTLRRKYFKQKLRHLKYLGVDEIAVREGHSYLTVVVALETGAVVCVAPDRFLEFSKRCIHNLKHRFHRVRAARWSESAGVPNR